MVTIGILDNFYFEIYDDRCSLAGTDLNRRWRKPSEVLLKYLRV